MKVRFRAHRTGGWFRPRRVERYVLFEDMLDILYELGVDPVSLHALELAADKALGPRR
jgi:hypothetical protein